MQSQAWELVMDSSEVHPGIKAETAENLAVLHLVADHERDAARFLLAARKVGCHRPHSVLPACLGSRLPSQCGRRCLLTVDHLSALPPWSAACKVGASVHTLLHAAAGNLLTSWVLPTSCKVGQVHAVLDFEEGKAVSHCLT